MVRRKKTLVTKAVDFTEKFYREARRKAGKNKVLAELPKEVLQGVKTIRRIQKFERRKKPLFPSN